MSASDSAQILSTLFEDLTDGMDEYPEELQFMKSDMEDARDQINEDLPEDSDDRVGSRNMSALIYQYRGTTKLPENMRNRGYEATIPDDTVGGSEPAYMLTKERQVIDLPHDVPHAGTVSKSNVPPATHKFFDDGEESTETVLMALLKFNNVICDFLGGQYQEVIRGNKESLRGRQVELDSAGSINAPGRELGAVVIEVKGSNERLNKNQLQRNIEALRENYGYENNWAVGIEVSEDYVYLLEYDASFSHFELRNCAKYDFDWSSDAQSAIEHFCH